MTETDLMNSIRVALSEKGCTVFRCNVGKIKTADGRYFDTGLPVGYSDLFGFKPGGQVFLLKRKCTLETDRRTKQVYNGG